MTLAIGCLLIGIGLYLTLFIERFIARAVRHTRSRWVKELVGSDLYALFIWLGGVGAIAFGAFMIFLALA